MPDPLTAAELEAIRTRCEAATAPIMQVAASSCGCCPPPMEPMSFDEMWKIWDHRTDDNLVLPLVERVEGLAADAARLLAEIERLRAENEALKHSLAAALTPDMDEPQEGMKP